MSGLGTECVESIIYKRATAKGGGLVWAQTTCTQAHRRHKHINTQHTEGRRPAEDSRVGGLGCRIWNLEVRHTSTVYTHRRRHPVKGLGFRVKGVGFGFRVQDLGLGYLRRAPGRRR